MRTNGRFVQGEEKYMMRKVHSLHESGRWRVITNEMLRRAARLNDIYTLSVFHTWCSVLDAADAADKDRHVETNQSRKPRTDKG